MSSNTTDKKESTTPPKRTTPTTSPTNNASSSPKKATTSSSTGSKTATPVSRLQIRLSSLDNSGKKIKASKETHESRTTTTKKTPTITIQTKGSCKTTSQPSKELKNTTTSSTEQKQTTLSSNNNSNMDTTIATKKRLQPNETVSNANTTKTTTTTATTPSVKTKTTATTTKTKMPTYNPRKRKAATDSSSTTTTLTTVQQLCIHHQISSLHFTYHNATWCYEGTTALYLTLSSPKRKPKKDTLKEIALHLRGGHDMKILEAQAFMPQQQQQQQQTTTKDTTTTTAAASSSDTENVSTVQHVSHTVQIKQQCDPLTKVLTKPCATFNPMDYLHLTSASAKTTTTTTTTKTKQKGRYEADTQCSRGGNGMMEALRCKSIASNFGEVRLAFNIPQQSQSPELSSRSNVMEFWKHDLTVGLQQDDGALGLNLKKKCWGRDGTIDGVKRRDERLQLIAKRLTAASYPRSTTTSTDDNDKKDSTLPSGGQKSLSKNNRKNGIALKLIIRFRLGPIGSGSVHLGGIHFHSPLSSTTATSSVMETNGNDVTSMNTSTPHVYTTSGTFGDHQGPRCWLPTVDSANSKHRCSHEMMVKVTSNRREGLWATGCGEHFGVSASILHPMPIPVVPELVPHKKEKKDKKDTTDDSNNNNNGDKDKSKDDSVVIGGDGDGGDEDEDDDDGSVNIVMDPHTATPIETIMGHQKKLRKKMINVLGKYSVKFIEKSLTGKLNVGSSRINKGGGTRESNSTDTVSSDKSSTRVHVIPPESVSPIPNMSDDRCMFPELATAMWTTCIWSPCPSRSLGLAIGPFKVLYDPEYYSPEPNEDEEESQQGNEDEEDEEGLVPTINETALKNGEGIRQLYFAPRHERCRIHSQSPTIGPDGCQDDAKMEWRLASRNLTNAMRQKMREIELSVIGSSTGVPNRALSLMRDVLSLPFYRTSSYTQIWIPNAVDGGLSCGTLHACPEVSCNPFLGGAIMDSRLLSPPGRRLPYNAGGRTLQFLQALCAVRGWITSALPLGGSDEKNESVGVTWDEIGDGYVHTLFESLIMSLYERAHGAFGEGGGRQSFFFSKRYAIGSGLNSRNMDFLPVANVEEEDATFGLPVGGLVGALPDEERSKEELYRNASNGTESHSSSRDEYSVRQLLAKDTLEGIERVVKGNVGVPNPSIGWLGSRLCTTFLTSNSISSSVVGCGALELVHPVGGMVYRVLKSMSLRGIIEGRAGISNFIRVMRAAFIAAIMEDKGETQVRLRKEKIDKHMDDSNVNNRESKPKFVMCVDEIINRGGITHDLFVRSLLKISGSIRELSGSLVDVSRDIIEDSHGVHPTMKRRFLQAEGFPNSYVRGSSGLYLRVGTRVEAVSGDQPGSAALSAKALHLHVMAEPVIPSGGVAFGGAVTLRVVETEGQFREFNNLEISTNGSRSNWGPILLHAKPVTEPKEQIAASGTIESTGSSGGKKHSASGSTAFNENELHNDGYQALELVRITNCSPLLWVRVDPHHLYNGRVSIFQPDSCFGEQLFHDGEASSQVEAIRALAERPLPLQGSIKIENVYGVPVKQLPVRLLADCLRGSVALHADLPHNPLIRSQAALAIAQWQNKEAPNSKDAIGSDSWVGLNLLIQYFNERFLKCGTYLPMRYSRVCLKKDKSHALANTVGTTSSGEYEYLDSFPDECDRVNVLEEAVEVENEEDEEHRVRSAVISAISSCRAKDGLSPPLVLQFLEVILQSGDAFAIPNIISIQEGRLIRKKRMRKSKSESQIGNDNTSVGEENILSEDLYDLPYESSTLVADSLLSLCNINARPAPVEDPTTGKQYQSTAPHPCIPLLETCYRWLEWDLYKEDIRIEAETETLSGIGGNSVLSACAITALCHLALLRQTTTETITESGTNDETTPKKKVDNVLENAISTVYYAEIFDSRPLRVESTRAAAAQAILCLACGADRMKDFKDEPLGLLSGLEFSLERIIEPATSPGLRHTLASLMFDACTGKIASTQRAAILSGKNDIVLGGSKLFNGPLGACYGNDNGSIILTAVSQLTMPVAKAVNDGSRTGLKLLKRAGHGEGSPLSEKTIVRVAKFATQLWRTINGELGGKNSVADLGFSTGEESSEKWPVTSNVDGVCSYDAHLRCILLSLWQWLWPRECPAVSRVQSWKQLEQSLLYRDLGADEVMKITIEEREAATEEEVECGGLRNIVDCEIARQEWRGEMANVAYDDAKVDAKTVKDSSSLSQGLNQPLSIVERDNAWENGVWISSTSRHRRRKGEDGGPIVKKIRLAMKSGDAHEK